MSLFNKSKKSLRTNKTAIYLINIHQHINNTRVILCISVFLWIDYRLCFNVMWRMREPTTNNASHTLENKNAVNQNFYQLLVLQSLTLQ